MNNRQCGSCTKCCEGYLAGEAHGHVFGKGRPCFFVSIGKGCSIYEDRPKHPCVGYKCLWISSPDILPEWMKPSEINNIIDVREIQGHMYISAVEAGSIISSKVLSWLISYVVTTNQNFVWECENGKYRIGSKEFVEIFDKHLSGTR